MLHIKNTHSCSQKIFFALMLVLCGVLFFRPHVAVAHPGTSSNICPGSAHRHAGSPALKDDNIICAGDADYILATASSAAGLFGTLLNIVVGIVVTLSFLFFFWNLVKYIRDEEGKEEAKTKMGYSILAIFVITSLWAIIAFIRNIAGLDQNAGSNPIELPSVTKLSCSNLRSEYHNLLSILESLDTAKGVKPKDYAVPVGNIIGANAPCAAKGEDSLDDAQIKAIQNALDAVGG